MKAKYLLIALMGVFLVSCQNTEGLQKSEVIYGVDFRPYTAKGFLFTPEKLTGEYESISMLTLSVTPEVRYEPEKPGFILKKNERRKGAFVYVLPDEGKALESLFLKAKDMGADAIMSLKIVSTTIPYNIYEFDGLEISGFAIKRKQ